MARWKLHSPSYQRCHLESYNSAVPCADLVLSFCVGFNTARQVLFLLVFLCGLCNFTPVSLGLQTSSPSSKVLQYSRRAYVSMHDDTSASRLPPFAPNEFVCRWLYRRRSSPPENECDQARHDLDTISPVQHEHLKRYIPLDWKSERSGSDPVVEAGIKLRRRTYHICPVRLSLKALALHKSQKLTFVLCQS